ncbi:MAG: hypothetical protein ACI9W6_001452 [Motiliproteus sp.]|jgi:hypothetical protein
MSEQCKEPDINGYPAIISSLRSPLSMFGLAMLICNAVFSLSAGLIGSLDAFVYAIHTFLAIVFSFIMIALWSPRSLYHPSDLEGISSDLPEIKHSRMIITGVLLAVIFSYAGYQIHKISVESEGQAAKKAQETTYVKKVNGIIYAYRKY